MAGKGPRKLRLSTNPTPEALAELKLGDVVYLDGTIYTAREGVYMRALEEKANIPMDLPAECRKLSLLACGQYQCRWLV